MPVTIKDIATKLNLSISTVSYALNDGPKPVSRDVYERVRGAAKELGYRPNRLARSLVTRRTHTIGLVPIDVDIDVVLTPLTLSFLNGAFNAANQLRQDVLVFTAHDRNLPDEAVDDMLDSRVDGVVFIAPRHDSPALHAIEASSLPYAIASGLENHSRCYHFDNTQGVREAMDHLFGLGHRRIGFVAGKEAIDDSVIRLRAFTDFMSEAGLPVCDEMMFQGDFRRHSGYAAGIHFAGLKDRPTAVFCSNDDMAFGLMDALAEKGIDVPRDISVVGFDDATGAADRKLTTVRQPLEAMAFDAFAAVVSQLQTGEIPGGGRYAAELIVRGSTATTVIL